MTARKLIPYAGKEPETSHWRGARVVPVFYPSDALWLLRNGMDTSAIASAYGVPEATVYNALTQGRR